MDMKELDRRIHKGVRNILISPLFEAGKTYNINSNSPNYQKEDEKGTMRPEVSHCYITWQSLWTDGEGENHWGDEAYTMISMEEAKTAKSYLEKHLR